MTMSVQLITNMSIFFVVEGTNIQLRMGFEPNLTRSCMTQIQLISLLWGDSIRKMRRLRKAELLIGRPPRGNGEINCRNSSDFAIRRSLNF